MRKFRRELVRFCFLCCGVCALLMTGCIEDQTAEEAPQMAPPTVVLSTATPQDVQFVETFTGRTEPCQTVDIISRTKGYLEEINYVPGEIVEPGTVLFKMQDFDYKIAQSKAYATLKTAVTKQEQAKVHYETAIRTNELTPNTVTADEMVDKKATYENARAEAYAAQAEYQYQTQQLCYTQIKSPIRGKVKKNMLHVGDYLQTPDMVLTTVVNMDPIYVEFDVPEAFFASIYRELIKVYDLQTRGPDKAAEASATQSMKTPEIPEAAKDHTEAMAAAAQAEINMQAQSAAPTRPRDIELTSVASPNIPKPEEELKAKDADASGRGVAGELADGQEGQDTKADDDIFFEITFPGDPTSPVYKGTVTYANNKVDRTTGTIMLRGEISNPKFEIYPGRICNVHIKTLMHKGVMVVEERALCTDMNSKYIWVLDSQGLVEKRYVKTGKLLPNGHERVLEEYTEANVSNIDGSSSIVKTGLKAGERYIVEGIQKVRPGIPVTEKGAAPAAAPATAPAAPVAPEAAK